jgi:5-methylcytosine-specific restriction endonuclease McrA
MATHNSDLARERDARYRARHKDRVLESKRSYRERNREALRAKGRAYAQRRAAEDPEYVERQRERIRSADPVHLAAIRKRSYDKHAEQRRAEAASRRTIRRNTIYDRDGGRCHVCGKQTSRSNFHIDHLIPRSKGGSDAAGNLAVTHPFCNQTRAAGRLPAQLRLAA